ncbi:MAG: NAD-binding protein [Candidatus Woesearchaeota archaeon]|nr:MAG: NAD-binding protein [Candidatus Woesearchaeota archaeon]
MSSKKILIPLIIIPLIILVGTIGFSYFDNFAPGDSFYLTMATVTTVGYGDIVPISPAGRLLASILSVLGIGAFVTTIPIIMFSLIEKSIRRVGKMKPRVKNHIIVCGYNPIAKKIISNLKDKKEKIVVITSNSEDASKLVEEGVHAVVGDPTEEDTLVKARVDVAKALLPVMDEDADNLLTTISSRTINKEIKIVAKVSQEKNISKLRKSGANEVFSPETLVGSMIAESAIK